MDYSYIGDNLEAIKKNIEESLKMRKNTVGDGSVDLLAVTKTVDAEKINYAVSKGIKIIGENRVNELLDKYDKINKENIEIHFIGRLQTNKVKYIIDKVSLIHSVDSLRLAEEINRQGAKRNIVADVLIEINIGDEQSKGGISKADLDEFCVNICRMDNIKVKGLMIVPPVCVEKGENDKYFQEIYEVFVDNQAKKKDNIDMKMFPPWDIISAGMSGDYMDAIVLGANMIRLGSAIFGGRK